MKRVDNPLMPMSVNIAGNLRRMRQDGRGEALHLPSVMVNSQENRLVGIVQVLQQPPFLTGVNIAIHPAFH